MSQTLIRVGDPSAVAQARRSAAVLAQRLGFDATATGELALLATELATNLVKHARGGELLLRPLAADHAHGVELIALDRGPGIANVADSLRDGYSTTGSPGTGMGALQRLATEFDLYTQPGRGTALRVALWPGGAAPAAAVAIGAISVPHPGETVCGDAWACKPYPGGVAVLVADGLGHGPEARRAAEAATQVLINSASTEPAALLNLVHAALRPTRGAAVAIADCSLDGATVRLAGAGNIGVSVVSGSERRHLVSHNGIAGHQLHKVQEFAAAWPRGSLLVLATDGVTNHWDFAAYPALASRPPALIAGVLYRDHARGRDDVCVVVLRNDAP